MSLSKISMLVITTLVLAAGVAVAQQSVPSPLLAIDQKRATVVDRIVAEWGTALAASSAGVSAEQMRKILTGLRADHLLAASLAGTLPGLRDVLANALTATSPVKPSMLQTKAQGDTTDDLVYTPVSPCRLFDTRPEQGGLGTMVPNVRRTYGAVTPVTNQGGPGGCNAAAGAAAALIQIGTLNPSGYGYLQGGAQGVASFPNALILFQPGDQYGTSVEMPLNLANGQFDLQLQYSATDLYGDLLGYFRRPSNYGGAHTITGLYATDSGGFQNTASGQYSAVAGGWGNIASGSWSTVAGGSNNTASNSYSTVAGGTGNTASGNSSFAAGFGAKAGYGSFVWSDPQLFAFDLSASSNLFAVRATNAINMVVAIDGSGIPTQFCNLTHGMPSWQCTSDRNAKENFVPSDGKDVLRRLIAMPLFSWNFKGADPSVRLLGPTAQDFYAAFGLGNDDLTIASVNLDGVALAAIQGLHQMMKKTEREAIQLKRELIAIKAKLGLNKRLQLDMH